jgi:hypothetical protein
LLFSVSCQPPGPSIPPVESFTVPAVGTLVPPSEIDASVRFPADFSGMMIVNSSSAPASIVISSTITTIPAGHGFVMALPPGDYQLYIYEQNVSPKLSAVQVEEKKVRYIYLVSFSSP